MGRKLELDQRSRRTGPARGAGSRISGEVTRVAPRRLARVAGDFSDALTKRGLVMHFMHFQKSKMARFVEAIRRGEQLQATGEQWTADDLTHLLGAVTFAIMSRGPQKLPTAIADAGKGPLGDAMREVENDRHCADVAALGMF